MLGSIFERAIDFQRLAREFSAARGAVRQPVHAADDAPGRPPAGKWGRRYPGGQELDENLLALRQQAAHLPVAAERGRQFQPRGGVAFQLQARIQGKAEIVGVERELIQPLELVRPQQVRPGRLGNAEEVSEMALAQGIGLAGLRQLFPRP